MNKELDPYVFEEHTVAGVRVLYKHLPWAPCIHISLSISAGAFQDPVGKEGVAHFLEHMIGNGSPLLPDRKAVKEYSRLYTLNSRNALTNVYRTWYEAKCLPEHLGHVFAHMFDYTFKPFLRSDDVEHERKVITQESWGRYKNEKFLRYVKEYIHNTMHGTERGRIASPLGWPETIHTITQGDIAAFHKTHYIKENLTVFLVGNLEGFDPANLTQWCADIPSGTPVAIDLGTPGLPLEARRDIQSVDIGNPQEQLSLSITSAVPESREDMLAATIQTEALLYDLLFEHLRTEHSLCYGLSANINHTKEMFGLDISVDTSEDKKELAEQEIYTVIEKIKNGEARERFTTIHKVTLDQIRSNEHLSGQILRNASNDYTLWSRIASLEEILTKVGAVMYEDVAAMTEKLFDKERLYTEIIHPSK